jgi:hypothetical protein
MRGQRPFHSNLAPGSTSDMSSIPGRGRDQMAVSGKQNGIYGSVYETIQKILGNLRSSNAVLAFSNTDYLKALGGSEKVLYEEQMEYEKHGISYIQIHPTIPCEENWQKGYPDQLVNVNVDSVLVGTFTLVQLAPLFKLLLETQCVQLVALHIHHLMNLSVTGLSYFLNSVQVPKVRVFLHDYYTVCSRKDLLRDGRVYCEIDCENCEFQNERDRHFKTMKQFFRSVDAEFVVPSMVAANVWGKAFPEHADRVRIIPHQNVQESPTKSDDIHLELLGSDGYHPRLAYLGYESAVKGLETWWRVVSDDTLNRNYTFFHLGAFGMRMPNVTYVPVSFLEEGPNAMVEALGRNRIDMAFLWSLVPETYSFTLHESFAANCFVITNEASGNIVEQVRDSGRGVICRDEREMFGLLYDVSGVRDLLLNHFRRNNRVRLSFNSKLAEESLVQMKPAAYFSACSLSDMAQWGNTAPEWEHIIRSIELEATRTEHIEELLKSRRLAGNTLLDEEKEVSEGKESMGEGLPPYSMEGRSHQMLDQVIQFLRRHPLLKSVTKSIFNAVRLFSIKLRSIIRKR